MTKSRALQRNRIALFLAVMLMFCAFGADGVTVKKCLAAGGLKAAETVLVCPGAGEFFTDSLPLQEQQSVRELSTVWQGHMVLRPGRITDAKSGCRETQVSISLPMSLCKITFYRNHLMTEGGAPAAHDTEVIICYIHSQDGAKG